MGRCRFCRQFLSASHPQDTYEVERITPVLPLRYPALPALRQMRLLPREHHVAEVLLLLEEEGAC